MDQNVLNELNLLLEKITIKNDVIKDEKANNAEYNDLEEQIKELKAKQKAVLENTIPDVLSEVESLKKEYNEALNKVALEMSFDKKAAKQMKKYIAKFNKLKFTNKFAEFAVETNEILELNRE